MNDEAGVKDPTAQDSKQYVFQLPHKKLTLNVEEDFSKRSDSMHEVKTHVRAARKEMLLALRTLIDKRIRRMEKSESKRADENVVHDIPLN